LVSWCMRGAVTDHRSALAKSLTRARAAKDAEMERELARLREENEKLRTENARLLEENARLRHGAPPAPSSRAQVRWADAGGPGTKPRKLERMRSYSPGEYSHVLPESPQSEPEEEPASASSVSFASDSQPARRRRLKSYGAGEYSEALGSSQESSSGSVSFSEDAADEPLPQRRQRLKSYSAGEYSEALGSSQESSSGGVSFSEDAADEPLPQRRQRLKSYSAGQYAKESLEQSSSMHSVSFEVDQAEEHESAQAAEGSRLRRLKSFDPGQYQGMLSPDRNTQATNAEQRSGKHLWGVARGTMAMAVGLPIAVARPVEKLDPNIAVASAVLVQPEPEPHGASDNDEMNHARPVYHPDPSKAVVPGLPVNAEALLQAEEQEHQAELQRISSGELPLSAPTVAGGPTVASSPTQVSDWPNNLAQDVAVRLL
jgi:hypothetical protein